MSKVKHHKNYEAYKRMILNSPAYQGLRQVDAQFGKFNWLGPLSTPKGKARRAWWDQQCQIHNIDINQAACYSQVAYVIHPTKKHVCQCCGKELSLANVYPHIAVTKKLNKILGTHFKQTDYTIQEIVNKFCKTQETIDAVSALFKGANGYDKSQLISHIEGTGNTYLSPGAMSNSPDRFDGYHSYGLCCRKNKDKGRHDSNMKLYGQDRRAYEEWADGDWNKANRLMSAFHNAPKMICPKCGNKTKRLMTADHIGPISLGFCHSIHFAPMCKSCNSSKNNRLSKTDVDTLLLLESQNETVVSWHSRYVWDKLKNTVTNDEDALRLSKIMNACHKNVLYLFYLIYSATGKNFLMRYLHPEYSMYIYTISKLDLTDLSKLEIKSKPSQSLNRKNARDRYVRIAFDALKKLGKKNNRRIRIIVNNKDVQNIIPLINRKEYDAADVEVKRVITAFSDAIITSFNNK